MSGKRVYVVTAKGNAQLTGGGTSLSPAELKLLVLVDGMASVEEIARKTRSQHPAHTVAEMLDKLARAGYVADPDASASINVAEFFKESVDGLASLEAKGYFVRIARQGAPRRADAGKITVLAIEDDPALVKLLRMYLQMEGFAVRAAATREEISRALREPPKPDVVLLDVTLPDSDGFEILKKMRAHELMKQVPIIMATAKATRQAVLDGLRDGADGYVTKPFDMEIVLKAINTVLGVRK